MVWQVNRQQAHRNCWTTYSISDSGQINGFASTAYMYFHFLLILDILLGNPSRAEDHIFSKRFIYLWEQVPDT
jgi:hypothetical protein